MYSALLEVFTKTNRTISLVGHFKKRDLVRVIEVGVDDQLCSNKSGFSGSETVERNSAIEHLP